MRTLLVRQTLQNGAARTWKLRPGEKAHTFGASRMAQLTSLDPASRGIQGVFEHRDGQWFWLSMDSSKMETPAETKLQSSTKIRLASSELSFQVAEKDSSILNRLEKETGKEVGNGTTPFELEIVRFGDRVLSTHVLKAGAKPSDKATAAKQLSGDKVTVLRRPIHLHSQKELMRPKSQLWADKDSRQGALIIGVAGLLCALLGIFGPKRATDLAIAAAPPPATKVMVMTIPKKISKGSAVQKKIEEIAKQPAMNAGSNDSAPAGKVAGLLKSVTGGRISQLLGKVSAQAARSREVVISNGVKAGEGPSGRALAALGKVEKGGQDWSSAAGGTGVTVSTAGRGGGKNASGMAGLKAGKTGQGGVGLIEDESEISGGLDREVIAQVIRTQLGQILYCYERQLSASPDLFGKVAVKFTINGTGKVESQAIGDTTLKNATVEGCILNKVASWKFPTPNGGTKVMVTYPFLFKSTN